MADTEHTEYKEIPDGHITAAAAAERCGVKVNTILQMCKRGQLHPVEVECLVTMPVVMYAIPESEISAYITQRTGRKERRDAKAKKKAEKSKV